MGKAILRRTAAKKPRHLLPFDAQSRIQVATLRLRRAQDVLSALAFCADGDADLSLGPVAVAARDLIENALDGLATIAPLVVLARDAK